jgi:hypothetical protein
MKLFIKTKFEIFIAHSKLPHFKTVIYTPQFSLTNYIHDASIHMIYKLWIKVKMRLLNNNYEALKREVRVTK